MQIIILALALGIFAHEATLAVEPEPYNLFDSLAQQVGGPAWLWLGLAVLLTRAGLLGLYALGCRSTLRRLGKPGTVHALRSLDWLGMVCRFGALGLYAGELWLGGLLTLRQTLGNLILIDELLFMLPTLAMIVGMWWAYARIERRLQEASLLRWLDTGRAVPPTLSRGQYVLDQVRHQLGLLLAPLMALMAWVETIHRFVPVEATLAGLQLQTLLLLSGSATVFVLTPLAIRHLWSTAPLPAGELRERLQALCQDHHVCVRDLLLWRTFGGVINAAVLGIVPRMRYILLTDGLLEMVPLPQVEAVMAHEVAHVRRRHMFWLLVVACGSAWGFEVLIRLVLTALPAAPAMASEGGPMLAGLTLGGWLSHQAVAEAALVGLTLVAWVLLFGWVSRRFERQADTFAVQHLAARRAKAGPECGDASGAGDDEPVVIDAASAMTMIAALQQVADLNHVQPTRRSWRHGSIAWRQAYLRSLVGQRVDDLPIDRHIQWIKRAGAAGVAAMAVAHLWLA